MENGLKKGKAFYFYILYTAFFFVAALLCFLFFILYKKTMIWSPDGLYQHYNAFLYYGKWAREIVRNLINDHSLIIPMWEWGFGSGGDIISSEMFYDPFFIVSVFTPTKYSEIGYAFTVILRLYLSGFVFCEYCKKMNCCQWSTLCASIIYVFNAYTIYAAPRHPYFANALIYIPLIFLGVEKILLKESFVFFSVGVALAALSGFYFFYMIVLFTILYVVLRFFSTSEYRKAKTILINLLKLFGSSVIGVMISGTLFLPTFLSFIENNTRVTETYSFDLFYTLNQYAALPGSLVSPTIAAVEWAKVGLAPLVYIGVFGSFINHDKKQRWARIYMIAEIVFLLFPFFGHMFNGFGYVTNRWTFMWSFVPSFLFAKEFPEIIKFENRKKEILCLCVTFYTLLCLVFNKSRVEENIVGLVLLLLGLVFVLFVSNISKFKLRLIKEVNIPKARFIQIISICMTLVCVFNIAFYKYSKLENSYTDEFVDLGKAYPLLSETYFSALKDIDDDSFYRIDTNNGDKMLNFPFFSHQPTTALTWSLMSKDSVDWKRLNNNYTAANFKFGSLTFRAWLMPQYCAKYFVTTNQAYVPYGYDYLLTSKGASKEYYLYTTENSLPFGSAYDYIISISDFENLSIAERQQAALQSCITDDITPNIRGTDLCYKDFQIDYNLDCEKNISLNDNVISVKKKNSKITLTFNSDTKGELYVILSGLDYCNGKSSTSITSKCNGISYEVTHYSERNKYSEGRSEYLLNLGYSEEERNTVTLTFSETGEYSFKEILLVCQPMDKLSEYIEARSEEALENVEFSTNKISGTIDLDKAKLLCLSLPYSKGWTAYVDGEKADLIHANIAFSGLMLEPGHHEIQLSFCTPYLKTGVLISVLGLMCLVVGRILFKHKESLASKFFKKINENT